MGELPFCPSIASRGEFHIEVEDHLRQGEADFQDGQAANWLA